MTTKAPASVPLTPTIARDYIKQVTTYTMPGVEFVKTSRGRELYLTNLTDQQAIDVACMFMDMEEEIAHRVTKQ